MTMAAERNTPARGTLKRMSYPMSATTTIYRGQQVVLSAGYAEPATAAASLIAVGCACETKTNSGADGAARIDVFEGCFLWRNSATDPLDITDVGATAYCEDDETVCATGAGLSASGVVEAIEDRALLSARGTIWVRTEV